MNPQGTATSARIVLHRHRSEDRGTLTTVADGATSNRRVRKLTSQEIASYDVISDELASRVKVIRVPFLLGSYQGMALGRFVFLRRNVPADGESLLLAHELVHVRQWSELGVVGFSVRYVAQFVAGLARTRSWNKAYKQIEIEQEAERTAVEWQQRGNLRRDTD